MSSTSLVEKASELEQEMMDGQLGDSTNTNLRYAAYLARLKPIFSTFVRLVTSEIKSDFLWGTVKSTRYLAYTSDLGEAFRPNINPAFVKGAYAVSWMYLGGDVAYEGWKAVCSLS